MAPFYCSLVAVYARRSSRPYVPAAAPGSLWEFLRDDPGTPLPVSGRTLREDGDSHLDAWCRVVRADVCSYCGRAGGTVDHVEPRSGSTTRAIGGVWSNLNLTGACPNCNAAKGSKNLLRFLDERNRARPARRAA